VSKKSSPVPVVPEAEFLSVDEAAALLRVDRKSLYSAVDRREVPGVVRIGRVIRIRRSALLEAA
jgi:excisionase family DNA binding protein